MMVGGLLAFVCVEGVGIGEWVGIKDEWSSDQKYYAKWIAGWTMAEALFFASNRIGGPYCPYIGDIKAREIAAGAVFASGLVAVTSVTGRAAFTRDLGDKAPPGPDTNPG